MMSTYVAHVRGTQFMRVPRRARNALRRDVRRRVTANPRTIDNPPERNSNGLIG
jgi:hypothetical protein